jgi:hypothetical protein
MQRLGCTGILFIRMMLALVLRIANRLNSLLKVANTPLLFLTTEAWVFQVPINLIIFYVIFF